MIGGLAVRGNMLCVTWSAGRGHVLLYDIEARERVSSWTTPVGGSGFSDAGGVAIDRHFRVFVADPHNDCVRRYNAFGQHLGDLGAPPPVSGDRGRDRVGVLDRPHAVCVLGDRVFVAAGERERRRSVQCYDFGGGALASLPCEGDPTRKWGAPRGISADRDGLVVADTLRGALLCYAPNGAFQRRVALPLDRDASEGGGPARPGAVVRLADGGFLVVDHGAFGSRLHAFDVRGCEKPLGELAARVVEPLGVALDEARRVYVLDHAGERVLRCDPGLGFDQELLDLAEFDGDAPGGPG